MSTARVIPIADQRLVRGAGVTPRRPPAPGQPLLDARGRPLRDLRISVTDRCNFRCSYCMPREVFDTHHRFLPHAELLSFEEITQLARVFVSLGVDKIRLTGGEPLLRRNIETLVAQLAALRTPDGRTPDLTLTTNGSALAKKAQALKDAGLQRLTVSLDAIDDATFRRMNDADFPVADVLAGIEAAHRAGLAPIKVNMVVKRGVNDDQIVPMARHFRGQPVVLRFIEFMDVGETNGWRMDEVVPSREVLARIGEHFPLVPLDAARAGETAERWRYADGQGEVGVISSVTQAFCHDCNRARLSTDGRLYTCLFGSQGHDLRAPLRAGIDDDRLAAMVTGLWSEREDRYSEQRATATPAPEGAARVEMHFIGG